MNPEQRDNLRFWLMVIGLAAVTAAFFAMPQVADLLRI